MVQLITATIPLRQKGSIGDMARMTAAWWAARLIVDGVRYGDYEVRNLTDVNQLEDELTEELDQLLKMLQPDVVWHLTAEHPMLRRKLTSARLPYQAHWPRHIMLSVQISSERVGTVVTLDVRKSDTSDDEATIYYHVLED